MNIKLFFSLSLVSILLVSCIPPKEIEELGIIHTHGIDRLDDGQLKTTLVVFKFEEQADSLTKIVSGKGNTMKGAMEDANQQSEFPLIPGKIKMEVFGEKLAEEGILPYLDTLSRDARMADMMYLAISDETAEHLLTISEDKITNNIGQFLYGLIENHTTDHNIPRKTVQDFLRIYYDNGQDNVLPVFSNEDKPKIENIGVFRGDQYVGDITVEQAILLNLMSLTIKEQLLELSLPIEPFEPYLEKRENRTQQDFLDTGFLIIKGSSKTKLVDQDNLIFDTHATIKLRLLEETDGLLVDDSHVIDLLEKEVEKNLIAQFEALLTKLQTLKADPFGYGKYYRIKQKDGKLSNDEWREKFPDIHVNFHVDAQIIRHGATK